MSSCPQIVVMLKIEVKILKMKKLIVDFSKLESEFVRK